jgi:hypothetical protein
MEFVISVETPIVGRTLDVYFCWTAASALDAAHQTYNVAIAKADGNRKVALATCESQSGDSQKAGKDQAEADYKTATS